MSFLTSSALASSTFTINPACFSDIHAPPILYPFKPASSMSFPAKLFGGLLNTEPALG